MTAHQIQVAEIIAITAWLILCVLTAAYAGAKGLPWFPILVAELFLPVIGFPLALLLVALAPSRRVVATSGPRLERGAWANPESSRGERARGLDETDREYYGRSMNPKG